MKKIFFIMALAAVVCSCSKKNLEVPVEDLQESVLKINLSTQEGTRASGPDHGIQSNDNQIQTLEIFVFRINTGSEDDGILDGYRKFTADELGNLTNLEVRTTTGNKKIYAVANSHRTTWKGVNKRSEFEQQTTVLADENLESFVMVGSTEAQLLAATTVSFNIRRLVARVKVNSIKTVFKDGPYEDMELKNVKAYLLNAQAEKYFYSGSGGNLKVYNKGVAIAEDADACTIQGMIYEDLKTNISDAGYETPHYFYCYENSYTAETEDEKFTRVVIEGELDGTVYYYPVVLKKVVRNCSYSIDVVIKRPGSLDPGKDVEMGTLLATVTVKDWEQISGSTVEF